MRSFLSTSSCVKDLLSRYAVALIVDLPVRHVAGVTALNIACGFVPNKYYYFLH